MTNSKTVDEDWVVAAQWRTNTATNYWLHTVKFIRYTLVPQLVPFFNTQLVDTS